MLEIEKLIFVKMNDLFFVKKFIDVLSLEEYKGRDKFRNKYLIIFKVRVCFRILFILCEYISICKLCNGNKILYISSYM